MRSIIMKINLLLFIFFFQVILFNNGVHALENNAVLSWQVNSEPDLAGYKVYTGTSPGNYSTPIDVGNQTSHTITGLSLGTHYFSITAYDTSGNESTFSNEVSKTFSNTPAPIQSGIQASNIQSDSATISWITDQDANSQVEYGTTNTYGSFSTLNTSFARTHNHTITALLPATTYHYRVINTDLNGNTTTSADKIFISLSAPDTQAPTTPTDLSSSAVSSSQVTLTWTASTDNIAVTGYRIYRDGLQIATTASTDYTDTGLVDNTSYLYTVSAFDASGNGSAQSTTLSVTTNASQALVINNLIVKSGQNYEAVLNTLTDNVLVYIDRTYSYTNLPSTVLGASYIKTANGDKQATDTDFLSFDVNLNITLLVVHDDRITSKPLWLNSFNDTGEDITIAGTQHSLWERDFPAGTVSLGGNEGSSSNSMYTVIAFKQNTGPSIDLEAPSIPTDLASSAVSASQVTLTWTASTDNIAVSGYRIYRDGLQIATTVSTGYADTGLVDNTSYLYTVSAFDASGNGSAQSTTLSVTTNALPDTQAPTMPTSLLSTTLSTSEIMLSWTASTDNVGVVGYQVFRDGIQIATTATNSYSDTGLTDDTTYSYTVSAFDAAGNVSAQSFALSVTTNALPDTQAPTMPTSLLSTTLSTSEIMLSWTASTDNVGVVGYQVFRDDIQIATAATNSYSDTGLTDDTTYSYTVSAFDAAGNTSDLSNTVLASTFSNDPLPGEISVSHSIGSNGRDFANLQNWEDARDGDLINRHYFAIKQQINPFLEGEIVFGASSGAQGNYLKERDLPSNTETHMSLDNVLGLFQVGEAVIGATSGASAIINNILSNSGTIEKGEAYADSVFSKGVVIDGSTTSTERYMWLSVAASQRHQGIAGSGVVIDTTALNHVILIRDDHTRVEGFEITGWPNVGGNNSWEGVHVAADNALLTQLLIHDDDYGTYNNPNSDAINLNDMRSGQRISIRNSIIYNIARGAINYQGSEDISIKIENLSIFNTGLTGADGEGGINIRSNNATLTLQNTISMNSGSGDDFKNNGFYGSVSNNISSDDSAPGTDSLSWRLAAEQFISIAAGTEDLHLKAGAEAVNQGIDLSNDFTDDIDGNQRTNPWDIGADEQ